MRRPVLQGWPQQARRVPLGGEESGESPQGGTQSLPQQGSDGTVRPTLGVTEARWVMVARSRLWPGRTPRALPEQGR